MKFSIISASCLFALVAAPALAGGAGPKVYAYSGVQNLCPNNTQPITINGVICCGTPNQSMTYQQVKGTPVMRSYRPAKAKTAICPEGEKGCRYE